MKIIHFAAIASILILSASEVNAGCTKDNLIVDGIFGRGSMVCTDGKWLDRRASILIAAAATECRYKGYAWVEHYINRGTLDFEHKLKELGKASACKMVDDAMAIIGRDAPVVDEGDSDSQEDCARGSGNDGCRR